MYNDAIPSCSISLGEPPPEAQERSEDRLGGHPTVPELAPAAARAQRAAMANAHLNLEERIELEAALRAGDTQAIIAIRLARSAGTISRELALNGGPRSYRATEAHRAAQGRRGAARRVTAPSTSTRRCGPKFTSACIVAGRQRRSLAASNVITVICP